MCVWITAVSLSPPQGLFDMSNSVLLMSCGPPASAVSYIPPVFFPPSFVFWHFYSLTQHRWSEAGFFFLNLKHVTDEVWSEDLQIADCKILSSCK